MAFRATPTMLQLLSKGVPVRQGVITTAGASTTNTSTAAPFTIPAGAVVMVIADAACVVAVGVAGLTVNNVYTATNMGVPMAIGVPQIFALRDGPAPDTTIAIMGAAAVNAVVFIMR